MVRESGASVMVLGLRESFMVRPHSEALQATGPRSALYRRWCGRCLGLASPVRLAPRAPRRLPPVAPGARASQAASPALAPLALRHRAQPTPIRPSPQGSRLEPSKFRGQVKGARERSRARGRRMTKGEGRTPPSANVVAAWKRPRPAP